MKYLVRPKRTKSPPEDWEEQIRSMSGLQVSGERTLVVKILDWDAGQKMKEMLGKYLHIEPIIESHTCD